MLCTSGFVDEVMFPMMGSVRRDGTAAALLQNVASCLTLVESFVQEVPGGKSALIHDLLFLPISTIESAVGKRLITHCCVSRLACSRLSGYIEPHSPRLQA